MLLLEKSHPALQAAVERIVTGANVAPTTTVRDFDGCEYHVRVEWKDPPHTSESSNGNNNTSSEARAASVTIGLEHTTPFKELNTHHNFDDVLPTLFPSTLQKFVQPGAQDRSGGKLTAEVRIPSSASEQTRRDAIQAASQLRAWSYIPLFAKQCEVYLLKPELVKPLVLHYHHGEEMVLYSYKGNFIVAIALRVASKDDAVFTRHYLQTFMDAKKLQREISAAPAFAFEHGKSPESIPSSVSIMGRSDPDVFWCSFQLFRRQMEPIEHLVETVTQLINFRSTLFYHIHAGRTYMHGMMRKRVETSLQVLNRAKTKTTGKAKIALN